MNIGIIKSPISQQILASTMNKNGDLSARNVTDVTAMAINAVCQYVVQETGNTPDVEDGLSILTVMENGKPKYEILVKHAKQEGGQE